MNSLINKLQNVYHFKRHLVGDDNDESRCIISSFYNFTAFLNENAYP